MTQTEKLWAYEEYRLDCWYEGISPKSFVEWEACGGK